METQFVITGGTGMSREDRESWVVAVAPSQQDAQTATKQLKAANDTLEAYIRTFNRSADYRGLNPFGEPWEPWQCEMDLAQYSARTALDPQLSHPAVIAAWKGAPEHPDPNLVKSLGSFPEYDIVEVPTTRALGLGEATHDGLKAMPRPKGRTL